MDIWSLIYTVLIHSFHVKVKITTLRKAKQSKQKKKIQIFVKLTKSGLQFLFHS